MFCPDCNKELPNDATECYVCGCDLTDVNKVDWVVLGTIENKLYADFAKEVLSSYNIPAVVLSKSGFFGNIGLPLYSFYKSQAATFEISVPSVYSSEAAEIMNMVAGDRWQRKEN